MAAEASEDPRAGGRGRAAYLRLLGRAIPRLGWGIADQIVSSLTNFAVGVYVVRELGAVQFGAFSIAFVTYAFALNASRGLATDPLMVRFSGASLPSWRRAVAGCTGTALSVGLVFGVCAVGAALVLHGAIRGAFLALGLTLPGLMLQDSWRFSFFALGRGARAFINDSIWAATMVPALLLMKLSGHASVFWFVFTWGCTAAVGALIGPLQAGVLPRLSQTRQWLSQHRDLGWRYLAEGTFNSAANQLRTYSIGFVLGLAALGSVQAAATLFGPMTILFLGMSLVTIPEAARVLRRSPRHLPLFCMLVSCGLTVAAVAWGIVLLIAVPKGFGGWLLGSIWRPTYPLVLPQLLYVVGQGVGYGVSTGLHALGASRRSVRVAWVGALVYVSLALGGALVWGAAGTVAGAAASAWISSLFAWQQFFAAQRDAGHLPARDRARDPVRDSSRGRDRLVQPGRLLLAFGGLSVMAAAAVTGWLLADATSTAVAPQAGSPAAHAVSAPARVSARSRPHLSAARLVPTGAWSFDPFSTVHGAAPEPVTLTPDGQLASVWHTQWYDSAAFGNLKPGSGLLLDMGQTVTIGSVRLLLGDVPGADFQIRIGVENATLDELRPAGHRTDIAGVADIRLGHPRRGRYLLIWFTRLPPDLAGHFQATIYQITITGTSA